MKMASSGIKDHYKVKKDAADRRVGKDQAPSGSHKETDNKDLQILRNFDLDFRYGPCSGITRLERWERASKHNLHPPQEVYDILMQNKDNPEYINNVWADYCV